MEKRIHGMRGEQGGQPRRTPRAVRLQLELRHIQDPYGRSAYAFQEMHRDPTPSESDPKKLRLLDARQGSRQHHGRARSALSACEVHVGAPVIPGCDGHSILLSPSLSGT
jgi:hypothetical protein